MEDFLLLNISNYILQKNFFKKLVKSDKNSLDDRELEKITPSDYKILKLVMIYLFVPLKPLLYNLETNVCFLEIDDKYEDLKISCDWCSICNGIVETAKQNIIKNPRIIKLIDFEKLQVLDKLFDFVLIDRTEKLTNKKTEEWCYNTFGEAIYDNIKELKINLILFSKIYLKLEMIELRWCPFKRSKEFYYRNKDNRYLEPTEKIIYEVGKILSIHETITCNNCPRVINEKWKYTKSNKLSIFQPLLDYMVYEINK